MTGIKVTSKLIIFSIVTLFPPIIFSAKPIPSDFSELVTSSELIAIVDVFEIKSQGKSMPGSASATMRELVLGQSKNTVIKMHWQGLSISSLGQWVVFLKKKGNAYQAAYGAKSFWKIEHAKLDNTECCSPFVVLQPPINRLNIDPSLVSEQLVYIDGVPREHNPIKVRGIEIKKLLDYVNNLTRNDALLLNFTLKKLGQGLNTGII